MDCFLPLLIAQDAIDPMAIGETLGQAQNVQQILGTIIGVLLLAVLALAYFYLKERKAWTKEQAEILKECAKQEAGVIARWSEAKVRWEKERHAHTAELAKGREAAADVERGLMREMLDLALRIDKSLTKLAEWKDACE